MKAQKSKKSFANLKPDECGEIFPLIFKNGLSLLETANSIATLKKFGPALGLTILGAEEVIKSMLIYFRSIGMTIFSHRELGASVNSSHKRRHETAIIFEFIRMLLRSRHLSVASQFKGGLINSITKILAFFRFLDSAINNTTWWHQADDYKNRGFYSDYVNEKFTLPSDIPEEEYLKGKINAEKLIEFFEDIRHYFDGMDSDKRTELISQVNKLVLRQRKENL